MPYAALKPCSYPGCSNLVKTGRCALHKQDDRVYRDPERDGLYNRRAWKELRVRQLAREPWCAECQRLGVYTPATDVDHVMPHRGDRGKFVDINNLQSLCHSCHSRKTASEVLNKGRGG